MSRTLFILVLGVFFLSLNEAKAETFECRSADNQRLGTAPAFVGNEENACNARYKEKCAPKCTAKPVN